VKLGHAAVLLCVSTACSPTNGASGSDGGEGDATDAAFAADGPDGGDGADDGRPNVAVCQGGADCGLNQICCGLPGMMGGCLDRTVGCPALSGYPEGLQLCYGAETCVMPGYVCGCGPAVETGPCRLGIRLCWPSDDGGGDDGSDGSTEASADAAAVDLNNATDAAYSSDVATDASGD
jgi:hypothetical protein